MRLLKVLGFLVLLLTVLAGCGSEGEDATTGEGYGGIAFRAAWNEPPTAKRAASTSSTVNRATAMPASVVTVRLIVTGPGMNPMQQDFVASLHTGSIPGVPIGSGRVLTMQGRDSSGTQLYEGSVANIAVTKGQNADAGTVILNSVGNLAPVANAGVDQNVINGSVITLDGSNSSDANSDNLAYSWSFVSKPAGSTAALNSATAAKPTIIADKDGSYVLQLVVNDGTVSSSADTVTITAATANSAPVANAGVDQNVVTGATVSLDGSASSDANGDTLTYSWSFVSKPTGSSAVLSSSTVAKPTIFADKDGSYVLQLVVDDGTVSSFADTLTITTATANSAPVANAGIDQNVATGVTVTLDGSASSDANGNTLTYSWSFVSKPTGSTATLSSSTAAKPTIIADKDGSYVLRLVVNDGTVSSFADTVTITTATTNSAPVANAGIDQNVWSGVTVTLDGSASSDANGDTLTYSWTFVSKPTGSTATLSSSNVVVPTFTADLFGHYEVHLVVNDGDKNSVVDSVIINSGTYTDNITGMQFVYVPPGTFSMGDTFGDGEPNERPVHSVTLTKGYWLGTFEVTQGQWLAVMGSNPSHFSSCGSNCPVENVSWIDVQNFIATLNSQSSSNYRLPTEAEWEYAARSGGLSQKYPGTDDVAQLGAYAWYYSNSGDTTHPVGEKLPNGLGLFDMSGNVWEWVNDWSGGYPLAAQSDPPGPVSGLYRVSRGGSWLDLPVNFRSTFRYGNEPIYRYFFQGFRLAFPAI